jgi:hypothetical protein
MRGRNGQKNRACRVLARKHKTLSYQSKSIQGGRSLVLYVPCTLLKMAGEDKGLWFSFTITCQCSHVERVKEVVIKNTNVSFIISLFQNYFFTNIHLLSFPFRSDKIKSSIFPIENVLTWLLVTKKHKWLYFLVKV